MKYLFVVAHPDDEILGAGATINKLIQEGNDVAVAFMVNQASARANLSCSLEKDKIDALKLVGVNKTYSADFPNIKMNIVPHLDLVQFVEKCIQDFEPDVIFTHHPSDLNNDHVVTSFAVQAASRLFERRNDIKPLKELIFMEILSSTEWSFASAANRFNPNFFVEIGSEGLELKIKALEVYKGVMRPYPHPRSREAIKGLAAYRGSQSGCNYAESFESVFRRS